MIFDPDKAIKSCEEDELDRCGFSKSLGNAIFNCSGEDSMVIGLLGKWGYGKTSIINMAVEHIENISKAEDNPPIIVKFNPWLFSNQNQLIKKFFDEISINIKDNDIVNKLKSYVDKIIPPIIGLATIIDPARAQGLLKTAEYVDGIQSEEDSLESLKGDINYLIIEKNVRIIVIIDDIERLPDFEIRQIFQLVKLIADFPNTTYLLSFDRSVVIKAIEKVQKGSGENYLEKIVQIPFEVPKLSKKDKERILISKMNNIIKEIPEDRIDQVHWWNLYHSGIKTLFKNIRDINRYINTLQFNFGMVKDEVNIVDFFAITCIQVFLPEVYYEIRENKGVFTELFGPSTTIKEKENAKQLCDNIINMADESFRDSLKKILEYMFPKLKAVYGKTHYGPEWLHTWRKDLKICSSDIFDIYFKLSIPKDKISKNELEATISLNNDFNLFKEELLNLIDKGKIMEFLEYFGDYIDEIPKENIENVIDVLMDIGDLFPQITPGLLKPDTTMKILQIIYQFTLRFDTKEEKYILLKNAIEKSENSLYIFVKKLSIEDARQGRYNLRDYPQPEENWTVDSDQLEDLERIACEKIEIWAEDGRLAKHNELASILFKWRRWDQQKAEEYISKLINNDEGLIDFISAFVEKSRTYSIEDKVSKTVFNIHFENIAKFVELDEIKTRIQNIKDSQSFEFNDIQEKAIKLFLENEEEV